MQDAPRNGPMFFRLSAPNGRTTHAGLLEFSAAEGFVALPPKVSGIGMSWGVMGMLWRLPRSA